METEIKPTIYLVKKQITDPKKILKKEAKLTQVSQGDFTLFYSRSRSHQPDWADFMVNGFGVEVKNFKNSSSTALIVIRLAGRMVAIPFGAGVYAIDFTAVEYNFGLKTALNCIPKTAVRQIDTTTPEANSQKTKKQTPVGTTPEAFGVNKQKDILRGITGKLPKDHKLGTSLDGKDSLRVRASVASLDKLKGLCQKALAIYEQDAYKKDYGWIDNIALVRDPSLIEKLVGALSKSLKNAHFEHMYFVPPVFYELVFDHQGFVFTNNDGTHLSKKTLFEMPDMADWKASVGDKRKDLTLATIDQYRAVLRGDDHHRDIAWPIQRCLAWETEYQGIKYVLSEGNWYVVAPDFFKEINDYYLGKVRERKELPKPSSPKLKESQYNEEFADTSVSRFLFDLGNDKSRSKSIGADANEVCDVYDTAAKTFYHVKMGKASADLSHLFRQGVFSGTALKQEETMRQQFIKHLTDEGCPADVIPSPFTAADYQIAFVLVLGNTQRKDIPFFSKVSLRDTQNALELIGYTCTISYVGGK